jgi:hypothetical protein
MAQMPFAEHNNMVKAIPSDRTDESLRQADIGRRGWQVSSMPTPDM